MTYYMIPRKPRSVRLDPQEVKSLKRYRKNFTSEVQCAISIGIDRTVLNNVILKGSGSVETIEKIRTALAK